MIRLSRWRIHFRAESASFLRRSFRDELDVNEDNGTWTIPSIRTRTRQPIKRVVSTALEIDDTAQEVEARIKVELQKRRTKNEVILNEKYGISGINHEDFIASGSDDDKVIANDDNDNIVQVESDNDDDDVEVVVRAVKTKCNRTVKIKRRKKKKKINKNKRS